MITLEVTRLSQPPLRDIPKGLMTEKEVQAFWLQVSKLSGISTRSLRQIQTACETQLRLLKLRGAR